MNRSGTAAAADEVVVLVEKAIITYRELKYACSMLVGAEVRTFPMVGMLHAYIAP